MSEQSKPDIKAARPNLVRSFTPGTPFSNTDFLRNKLEQQQNRNFHSSSINTIAKMVSQPVNAAPGNPVNKVSLPSGRLLDQG